MVIVALKCQQLEAQRTAQKRGKIDRCGEQLLEVIEHKQPLIGPQVLDQQLQLGLVALLMKPERMNQRGYNALGVADMS